MLATFVPGNINHSIYLVFKCESIHLCLNTKKKDCKAQLHDYAALGIPNAGNSREESLTEWELLAIKKKPARQDISLAPAIACFDHVE